MLSFFLVFFIGTTSGILFCGILDVPSRGIGTIEAGVGALVPVSVTVVDARTIPWSGRTTHGSLYVCLTPGSVPASPSIRLSSSEENSFACADANSEESCTIVSVKVATVAYDNIENADEKHKYEIISINEKGSRRGSTI